MSDLDDSFDGSGPGNAEMERRSELLRQARIDGLRALTSGDSNVVIGLIDGPVEQTHPCFDRARIIEVSDQRSGESAFGAVAHATCVASMLVGRGNGVVSLCPDCTLLSFPIIDDAFYAGSLSPKIAAERIACAIVQAVASGASVIQLSLEFSAELPAPFRQVREAVRYAAGRRVKTVIAAGNRPTLGANAILTAPGAVPVGMGGTDGLPHPFGALGVAIGTNGLLAPGTDIPGAVPPDRYGRHAGSSYAASFVTGTYSLLRSHVPKSDSDSIWAALLRPGGSIRQNSSIAPPPLDGAAALKSIGVPAPHAQNAWILRL
jgi:subtilisin family serine protease